MKLFEGNKEKDFESWHETHFEIVSEILTHRNNEPISSKLVEDTLSEFGTGGLYELAKNLTTEFETLHEDRLWDGDFLDELEDFLNVKLN